MAPAKSRRRSARSRRVAPALVLPLILAAILTAAGAGGMGCAARSRVPEPDGAHLMQLVTRQVDLGPRVPGTAPHQRGLEWIEAALRASGARVSEQAFTDTVPGFGVTRLTNVVAFFGPAGGPRLLFAAHWDCRPWCDRDPDTTQHRRPLPGANDSGSGVAVLLALAEAFSRTPPARPVDLAFLDGEDLGTGEHPESFFRGSKHFAALPHPGYKMGVLLDMVGGRGARFPREPNSMLRAPEVTQALWTRARQLHLDAFTDDIGPTVIDDHVPLNDAAISTADIIDLTYPEWHTSRDLPSAMDASGLKACFRLLASLAYDKP